MYDKEFSRCIFCNCILHDGVETRFIDDDAVCLACFEVHSDSPTDDTDEVHSDMPIGFLSKGRLLCYGCNDSTSAIVVFHSNIFPYRGTCSRCGKILVKPRNENWPELFSENE